MELAKLQEEYLDQALLRYQSPFSATVGYLAVLLLFSCLPISLASA